MRPQECHIHTKSHIPFPSSRDQATRSNQDVPKATPYTTELVVVDILFWPLDDRWGLHGRSRLNTQSVGSLRNRYPMQLSEGYRFIRGMMRSETFKTRYLALSLLSSSYFVSSLSQYRHHWLMRTQKPHTQATFKPLLNKLVKTPEYFNPHDLQPALEHVFTPGSIDPTQIGAFLSPCFIFIVLRGSELLATAASLLR